MFLNPIGLVALAALPAIVAIHFFRRRFQPRIVSAIFLWEVRDRTPAAGRKLERLRSSTSLWMEMLAALFAGFAIAGFRPFGANDAQHFVAVLDGSFVMGARVDNTTFRERAILEVRKRIASLSRNAAVTIVKSGPTPEVVAGPRAFAGEAIERLASFEPAAPQHDLTPAIALAEQFARGGTLLLVTCDFRPELVPARVEVVSVGEALDNLAITHATRTNDKLFLTLDGFTRRNVKTRFALEAHGKELASRDVELEPGKSQQFTISLPSDAPAVEGAIVGGGTLDSLDIDSRVRLCPPPARRVYLTSSLPDESARALGLWSGKGSVKIDRLLATVADAGEAPVKSAAHVELCETAPAGGRAWALCLETKGKGRAEWLGPFLKDKRHPLMEGLTLDGVIWSADPKLELSGAPIVSAGNRVLLSEIRDAERRLFHINLDGGRSNLPRSPDWPIFLCNLVEARRATLPGPVKTNLLAGEPFTYQAVGDANYELRGPGMTRDIRARGTVVVDDLTRPGAYSLTRLREGGGVEWSTEFAVNFFDPRLSDLRGLKPGARPAEGAAAATAAAFTWIEAVLILAAIACVGIDWIALAKTRRLGVA